jgi:glycosyltransferase involved in cell wall biosynthesis
MSTRLPLVSIGIPTYNRATLVTRAIESALAQDYRRLEVIVSDNASTDGTEQACRSFAGSDARVIYVRQPHNLGATKNFEALVNIASGDYFMWLGDDDWIDPNYVRVCLEALTSDACLSLAGGAPYYYDKGVARETGRRVSVLEPDWRRRVIGYFWRVRDNGIFYGVARTEALRGLLPMRNVMGGDWLHVAALAAQGSIRTIEATRVHRELGGATTSYAQIARSLGLHPIAGRFPFTFIALAAFADIARHNRAYGNRSQLARCALAVAVSLTLTLRGCAAAAGKLRACTSHALTLRSKTR